MATYQTQMFERVVETEDGSAGAAVQMSHVGEALTLTLTLTLEHLQLYSSNRAA